MIVRASVVVAAAAVLAVVCGFVYGGDAAWQTFVILAAVGVVGTLAIEALVLRRGRLGGIRRQAAAVTVLAVAIAAVAVGLFIALMFVSPHDALLTVIVIAFAAALGGSAAALLGRQMLADLDAVRASLRAVGDGHRDPVVGVERTGELGELAADVDEMIARLDAEERARRSLVAAISHDLRTPITALGLLADAISDGVVDGDTARAYAARMGPHVALLGGLIDDLLELARLESGELRVSMQEVALAELVHDSVEAMRPQAEAASVAVRLVIDAPDPFAVGDRARLQRVLLNLIQNAIRHTPPDGTVTVRAGAAANGVAIDVADTGAGIPPPERERVFEPFHRLDPSRTDAGSGLGLAICRAIVEAHGGRIFIADAPRGTTVRVLLGPAAATPV